MQKAIETVTAAILVIGDEILSGRIKDKNIGYIAEHLEQNAIDVKEVRIVPDEADEIIDAIRILKAKYNYLFTTGGIGPTHDDITADCVAAAFNVAIDVREDAVEMMLNKYKREDLNKARLRMARIPEGASLVNNPISFAPGFQLDNVFVMAGVPQVMHAMLEDILPKLAKGKHYLQESFDTNLKEGDLSKPLGEIAQKYSAVSFGSYPTYREGKFTTKLVMRTKNEQDFKAAKIDMLAMIERLSE